MQSTYDDVLARFGGRPFTVPEAVEAGIPRRSLARLRASGVVGSPLRGIHIDARSELTLERRIACLRRLMPEHGVVVDRTAAWLWGIDLLRPEDGGYDVPLDVFVLRGTHRMERPGARGGVRDLAPRDWIEVDGLKVSTPLRTALDLACRLTRLGAIVALDGFMREHSLTRTQLQMELVRYRRRRGVVQARELVLLADALSESPGESMTRLVMVEEGLPAPVPQLWVNREDGRRYRLDLAYPALKIAVEYDGEEHHGSAADRAHDHERREWLRSRGWIVIVVTKSGLSVEARQHWIAQVRAALRSRLSAA